ncbi:hypothetical protein GW916_01625 [bacterium]|nr:hypothetical protein [bacterium]
MKNSTGDRFALLVYFISLHSLAASTIVSQLHIPLEDIVDRSNSIQYNENIRDLSKYLKSIEKTMVDEHIEKSSTDYDYNIVNTAYENLMYSADGKTVEFTTSTTVGTSRVRGKYNNFARILKCNGRVKVTDLPMDYKDFSKRLQCKTIPSEELTWTDEMSINDRMGILKGTDKDGRVVFQRYYPIGAARRGDKTGYFCYADGALDDGNGDVWRVGLDAYQYDGFTRNIHLPKIDPKNPEATYDKLFNTCETGQDVYDSPETHVTDIGAHGPVTKKLLRGAVSAGCRRKRNIDRSEHETIIWPLLQKPKDGGVPLVRLKVQKEGFGPDVFNHPYDFCGPKPNLHIPRAIPVEEPAHQ